MSGSGAPASATTARMSQVQGVWFDFDYPRGRRITVCSELVPKVSREASLECSDKGRHDLTLPRQQHTSLPGLSPSVESLGGSLDHPRPTRGQVAFPGAGMSAVAFYPCLSAGGSLSKIGLGQPCCLCCESFLLDN